MNFLISIFLCISLASTSVLAKPIYGKEKSGISQSQMDAHMAQVMTRANNSDVIRISAEVGRTYILIWVLAIAEIVKRELVQSGFDLHKVSYQQIIDSAGLAADHILDSGEIVTSLCSASATHFLLKKPLQIFNQIIANSQSRAIFKSLLQHMAGTLITFVGWDFGGQLWQEAKRLISESELSTVEFGLLKNEDAFWSYIFKFNQDSLRVLSVISEKLFKVLITDELRAQMLYNTIRNRLLKGEFATMVTTMVSVSVIGTTLFPGAGTIAGMMFGIVGGGLTILIPQQIKDGITNSIKTSWVNELEKARLGENFELLKLPYNKNGEYSIIRKGKISTVYNLKSILEKRRTYRELVADVYIERLYEAVLRANNSESDKLIYDQIIVKTSEDLVGFWLTEEQTFDDLIFSKERRVEFENQMRAMANAKNYFCELVTGLKAVSTSNSTFLMAACGGGNLKKSEKDFDIAHATLIEYFFSGFREYDMVSDRINQANRLILEYHDKRPRTSI